MILEGEGTAAAINYSQQALDTFNTTLGSIDFSVFMTMFVAVVTATIGVKIGMLAIRKGYGMLISFIRGL